MLSTRPVDTNEINALKLEISHLKEKCAEAQNRYEMLTVMLPNFSSAAQKARDDADTLIREIETRKLAFAQEVLELRGMIERKLKLRDMIRERIQKRVQHLMRERDALYTERDELAARCRKLQQRQQAIVQCEQHIGRLEEATQLAKAKLEKIKAEQEQRSKEQTQHPHQQRYMYPQSAGNNAAADLAADAMQEPRVHVMKNELKLVRTELEDIRMLLDIYKYLKGTIKSSRVEAIPGITPAVYACTQATCVSCTYQAVISAQASVSITEGAEASSCDAPEQISKPSDEAEKMATAAPTATVDRTASNISSQCAYEEDSNLFSPRCHVAELPSCANSPAASGHAAMVPGCSMQLDSNELRTAATELSLEGSLDARDIKDFELAASAASTSSSSSGSDLDIGSKRPIVGANDESHVSDTENGMTDSAPKRVRKEASE